MLNDDLSPI